jgi:glycosyltransferase involved in cell wall biosynthesis
MKSTRKPRIAFLTYEIARGGSLTFLLNIGREFKRRDIDYCIIRLDPHDLLEADFAAAGVATIRPGAPFRFIEDGTRFGLEKLQEFRPTHIIGCLGPQSLEILRYVPKGVSRLGMLQTDDFPVYAMLAAYASVLDAVVSVSDHSSKVLRLYPQFANKAVYYLPHGILVPDKLIRPKTSTTQSIRIAYVGRLVREQKRVHLLPRIVQRLADTRKPFVIKIAGSGPQLSWLKRNLQTNSSQQIIRFEGQVPYDRIPELMLSSDIFLLPSDSEGMPISLLEAMAYGTVPVVSDLASGMRDLVSRETGILVKPDDIDGYSTAILKLDSDRDDLARKSLAASQLIQTTYSCEAMADRWLKMFDDLPSAPTDWPPPPKVKFSFKVRRLGLNYIPAVRAISRLVNQVPAK